MTSKDFIIEVLNKLEIDDYCFVGSMKFEDVAKDADVVVAPEYSNKIEEIIRKLTFEFGLKTKPVKRGKFLVSFEFQNGNKLDLIFSKDEEHFNFLCNLLSPSIEGENIKFKNTILKIIAYLKNYSLDWQDGLFKLYPILSEYPNKIIYNSEKDEYKILPSSYFKYEFVTRDLNEIANILLNTDWNSIKTLDSLLQTLEKNSDLKQKIKDIILKTRDFKKFKVFAIYL